MKVAAAGLMPISPTTEVVPEVEIPDFARIAKLPADPRGTAASAGVCAGVGVAVVVGIEVDVGAGVAVVVDVEVDVGAGVTVAVGVEVDVGAGVTVVVGVEVGGGVSAAVVVCVGVIVDVGMAAAPLQADIMAMASIIMIPVVSQSRFFFGFFMIRSILLYFDNR
jgi:hypothetical protein